jgi:radical SAM protein with 4Fe4S-binding SPASM domain
MNALPETGTHPWPRLVFWETTAACNLVCSHCRRTDVADEVSPDELSREEAEALIDELSAWGRTILVLSGGEPLMRPDILHLTSYAKTRGLIVALATNGTLIDQDLAKRIGECGVNRVSISLDGADEATHDAFRRLPGSFRSALAGAQALRAEGVPLQINVTVAKHNADQMDEMVSLAKELGAVALHLFLLVPVGCGMEIAEEQTLQADAYEETLNWLYETERRERGLELRATCAPHYWVVKQAQAVQPRENGPVATGPLRARQARPPGLGRQRPRARSPPRGHSRMPGRDRVCLSRIRAKSMAVDTCRSRRAMCGNQPFRDMADKRVLAELRDLGQLEGKCGRCGYSAVCGGCRARAYGSTGDFLAEEPFCAYEPGGRAGSLRTDPDDQGGV